MDGKTSTAPSPRCCLGVKGRAQGAGIGFHGRVAVWSAPSAKTFQPYVQRRLLSLGKKTLTQFPSSLQSEAPEPTQAPSAVPGSPPAEPVCGTVGSGPSWPPALSGRWASSPVHCREFHTGGSLPEGSRLPGGSWNADWKMKYSVNEEPEKTGNARAGRGFAEGRSHGGLRPRWPCR